VASRYQVDVLFAHRYAHPICKLHATIELAHLRLQTTDFLCIITEPLTTGPLRSFPLRRRLSKTLQLLAGSWRSASEMQDLVGAFATSFPACVQSGSIASRRLKRSVKSAICLVRIDSFSNPPHARNSVVSELSSVLSQQ